MPLATIHHIFCKGIGGDPNGDKDVIENLMALTREEHNRYGDKVQYYDFLLQKHHEFMENKGMFFAELKKKV